MSRTVEQDLRSYARIMDRLDGLGLKPQLEDCFFPRITRWVGRQS